MAGPAVTLREDVDFFADDILGSRHSQEDSCLFRANLHGIGLLAVLSDGMGGYENGALASKLAVETFDQAYSSYPSDSVLTKLGASLQEANHALAEAIDQNPDLQDMGCTLVGAFVNSDGLHWISVGDSPLFLWRGSQLRRLNADHSMTAVIQERLAEGTLTAEEAAAHPKRHELRSALTGDKLSMIDAPEAPLALRKGDVMLLASDGLLTLSESELSRILRQTEGKGAAAIVRALLAAVQAAKKPRQDNTTVQVIVAPVRLGRERGQSTQLAGRLALLVCAVLTLAAAGAAWKFLGQRSDRPPPHPVAYPAPVPKPVQLPEDPARSVNDPPVPVPPKEAGSSQKSEKPDARMPASAMPAMHLGDIPAADSAPPDPVLNNRPSNALPSDPGGDSEPSHVDRSPRPADNHARTSQPASSKNRPGMNTHPKPRAKDGLSPAPIPTPPALDEPTIPPQTGLIPSER